MNNNWRICQKSVDGRHNFISAGGDCFNGCGINQAEMSKNASQNAPIPKAIEASYTRLPKNADKMRSIHSKEHLLAKDISEAFGEPKKFALYLGTIKRVGFEKATQVFAELNQSRNIKTPARLFMWKCSKKQVNK